MVPVPQQDPLSFRFTPSVPLRMDPKHRRVWIAGKPLYVSSKEFIFLSLLNQCHAQGQPCPRDLLSQRIYFDEVRLFGEREERLYSLVAQLRGKLRQFAGQPVKIETVRGVGY